MSKKQPNTQWASSAWAPNYNPPEEESQNTAGTVDREFQTMPRSGQFDNADDTNNEDTQMPLLTQPEEDTQKVWLTQPDDYQVLELFEERKSAIPGIEQKRESVRHKLSPELETAFEREGLLRPKAKQTKLDFQEVSCRVSPQKPFVHHPTFRFDSSSAPIVPETPTSASSRHVPPKTNFVTPPKPSPEKQPRVTNSAIVQKLLFTPIAKPIHAKRHVPQVQHVPRNTQFQSSQIMSINPYSKKGKVQHDPKSTHIDSSQVISQNPYAKTTRINPAQMISKNPYATKDMYEGISDEDLFPLIESITELEKAKLNQDKKETSSHDSDHAHIRQTSNQVPQGST